MEILIRRMGFACFLITLASSFAIATSAHLRGSSSVVNCNAASLFQYDSGVLNPLNPPPNTNTTLELTFTNNWQTVTDGTVDFAINLNGLPYTYSEPLCSQNLPCPIELGQHVVYSNPINVGTTSGKLVITTNYKDSIGNVLVCVKTTMALAVEGNSKALIPFPGENLDSSSSSASGSSTTGNTGNNTTTGGSTTTGGTGGTNSGSGSGSSGGSSGGSSVCATRMMKI